jgi:pimeloyl-ACP methyl ester carboxylesterase
MGKFGLLSTVTALTLTSLCGLWYMNAKRRKASKSEQFAFIYPLPVGVEMKPYPLIFISEAGQSATAWKGYMEHLSQLGYECHGLNLVETGDVSINMSDQLSAIRLYCEEFLNGRNPILVGHGAGARKVQLYMIAKECDVTSNNKVKAMILLCPLSVENFDLTMAKTIQNILKKSGQPGTALMALFSCFVLGGNILSLLGGGPMRHYFQTYRYHFNANTQYTTLLSPSLMPHASASMSVTSITLGEYSDICMLNHEPAMTGADEVEIERSPDIALLAEGVKHLVIGAGEDRIVPIDIVKTVASTWGNSFETVDDLFIPNQGHALGDDGWELSVLPRLIAFINSI